MLLDECNSTICIVVTELLEAIGPPHSRLNKIWSKRWLLMETTLWPPRKNCGNCQRFKWFCQRHSDTGMTLTLENRGTKALQFGSDGRGFASHRRPKFMTPPMKTKVTSPTFLFIYPTKFINASIPSGLFRTEFFVPILYYPTLHFTSSTARNPFL